ncbi:MAG: hypothetical protein WBP16_08040, partial [Ferruginibacter sp.]
MEPTTDYYTEEEVVGLASHTKELIDYINIYFTSTEAAQLEKYLERDGHYEIIINNALELPIDLCKSYKDKLIRDEDNRYFEFRDYYHDLIVETHQGHPDMTVCALPCMFRLSNVPNTTMRVFGICFLRRKDIATVSESFYWEWLDSENWSIISDPQVLTEDLYRRFPYFSLGYAFPEEYILSDGFIREFSDKFCWETLSRKYTLSESIIREFSDKVNWGLISTHQTLSEGFIREFSAHVDWGAISRYQTLSEGFIREFSTHVDWGAISRYQTLSEGFIREFSDKVNWNALVKYQLLPENFIREFLDHIDCYSLRGPVSVVEEFIASLDTEGLKKVDWPEINQLKLSDSFRAKYDGWLRIGSLSDYDYSPYYDSDYSFDNPYQEWEQELLDDIEAYREDSARSEEDGWYYS